MMHFALDKQNIFYVSTPNSLSAIQLDKLELNYDKLSLNAIMGTQANADLLEFSEDTRRGQIYFNDDCKVLTMFDTEKSYSDESNDSVIAICDRKTLLDFNTIVCQPNTKKKNEL